MKLIIINTHRDIITLQPLIGDKKYLKMERKSHNKHKIYFFFLYDFKIIKLTVFKGKCKELKAIIFKNENDKEEKFILMTEYIT